MLSSFSAVALLALAGVAVFAATVMLLGTALGIFADRQVLARRLGAGLSSAGVAALQESFASDSPLLRFLSRFPGMSQPKESATLRAWLVRAGYRGPLALRRYHSARAFCAVGAAVIVAFLLTVIGAKLHLPEILGLVAGAVALGFMAPPFWVQRRIQRRREEAAIGFPDTLDMLLVCVEAGHGLDQSLARVAAEMKTKSPTLSEEFAVIGDELRAGKDRTQVLRDFADRIGVDDISAFITILNQSDQYGVSIGDALRVYASEMRNKRIMKAEEKANAMPVKIALGTILFTVPPVMIIMAGPSIVMLLRAFAMMTRH